jgi:hypothetical protein
MSTVLYYVVRKLRRAFNTMDWHKVHRVLIEQKKRLREINCQPELIMAAYRPFKRVTHALGNLCRPGASGT